MVGASSRCRVIDAEHCRWQRPLQVACVVVLCSVVRSAGEVALIDTKPLADSRLRKPLGDRAKLADPTPIARGSRKVP